jgi:putative transposase
VHPRFSPGRRSPVDLVSRDLIADTPGSKRVGDITYIKTWKGSTVIDCCTRQVIGWSMADYMRTSRVCDAISIAWTRGSLQPDAVFHSARGSQYTSAEFGVLLGVLNLWGLIGRSGNAGIMRSPNPFSAP